MKKKQLLSLGISLFLMASPAFSSEAAEEESQESLAPMEEIQEQKDQSVAPMEQLKDGQHIEVGTEPLPEDLQNQMNDERVEKYQEFKAQIEKSSAYTPKGKKANITCSLGARPAVTLASYSHSMHTHYLKGVSSDGRFIDTEDGSRWEIAPSDIFKVLRWRSNQTYVITPNSNWLTSAQYPYTITNQQHGSSARVKLILGPSSSGQNVHWIINYDPYLRLVYLENGTVWKVAEDDYPYFAKWKVNHVVIIGNYYPWFYVFYPYDSLLINVNMNHYVHAKQK